MKRVLLWIVDHPFVAAALLAVATAFFALQLPRLEIDPSAEGLMLEKDPARQYYDGVKQRFGSDNLTLVMVKADDVFAPSVLATIKRLSEALEKIDGITRVESLTTVKNIKGEGDTINTEPLVGTGVLDAAEAARVRRDALGNRVFVGNIVSADARATGITIYTDAKPEDKLFNQRFTDAVEALIAREATPGVTLYQIGSIYTKMARAKNIAQDQRVVIPLGIVVLLAILLIGFRTPQGVAIPICTALISIVWAMGIMALMGLRLNLLTSIVPSLLIAIGFTEDVHMIAEYHHRLEKGDDKLTAVRTMLSESALPILVTTFTTVAGFGSLIFTDVTMLIQFGWASSMGLAANFVVTVVVLPIMLRYWPVPRRFRRSAFADESGHGLIPRLMQRLGEFNLRYRVHILVVVAVLVAGSLVGWLSLRVDTDFIALFPKDSIVRQRIEDVHRALGGGLNFYVIVDTGRPDGIKDPAVLRKIAGLQDFLAGTGRVDKTVSLADYIRKMHREMNAGNPAFETIPDTPEQVAQYLLMLEGKELAKFVDFEAAAANIVVRHNITGSWGFTQLRKELNTHVAANFPRTVTVRATGDSILTNDAVDFLAINELTSFLSTFVVIGIIHALLFMSLRAGFLSLIPNAVPIVMNYGLMGLLGIPLNITTALVATIAIGIAVDDTVHHMVTYSRQLKEHHDQKIAMFNTLRSQGRPIIYVSLALAASFLTLTFSSQPATVLFGLLSALCMLLALAGELMLTPVLMLSTRLVTLWDMVLLKMNRDLVRTAPLLHGLSGWEARKVILLGKLQAVPAGELLIRKGDAGTEMYMIVTGRARVFDHAPDGSEKVLAVFEPGAVFGEMALVSQEVRSANVVAETPVEVLRLDFQAFERIRRRFPYTGAKLFRNLARVLAGRLRQSTAAMVTAAPDVAGAAREILDRSAALVALARGTADRRLVTDLERIHQAAEGLRALVDEVDRTTLRHPRLTPQQVRHELRNLVNHLVGYSDLFLDEAEAGTPVAVTTGVGHVRALGGRLLNLVETAVGAPARDPDSARTAEPALPAAGSTILVVDDSADNRAVLGRLLEKTGYGVTVAEHGRAALEQLRRTRIDAILLDIAMPDLDGHGTLAELKRDPALREIPVIMLSAHDDIASVARCLESGADDYLVKPVEPVLLRARLAASLELRRLRTHAGLPAGGSR